MTSGARENSASRKTRGKTLIIYTNSPKIVRKNLAVDRENPDYRLFHFSSKTSWCRWKLIFSSFKWIYAREMYDKVDVRMTSREVSWVIAGLTRPGVEKKWLFDETPKKNRRKNSIRKIFSLSLVHEKNEEIGVKWKGGSEEAREKRKRRTFSSPPWTLCCRFDSPFNFLA